jgi:hypothetical protein
MRNTPGAAEVRGYSTTTETVMGTQPADDRAAGGMERVRRYGRPEAALLPRSHVQWGGVFAGTLCALTFFVFASLLGMAIDVLNVFSGSATTNQYGWGSGIWTVGTVIVAFLIGGFVAEKIAGVRGEGNGWVNGIIVFVLSLALIIAISALGSGASLFGTLGTNFTDIHNVAMRTTAVTNATDNIHQGLWWSFIAVAAGVIFGAIGGTIADAGHTTATIESDVRA